MGLDGPLSSSPCQMHPIGDPVLDPRSAPTYSKARGCPYGEGWGTEEHRRAEGVEGVLLASATREEWPFLEWGMLGGGRFGLLYLFPGATETKHHTGSFRQ